MFRSLSVIRKLLSTTSRKGSMEKAGEVFQDYMIQQWLVLTAYTKVGLRFATFLGIVSAIFSFGVGIFYLIYKMTHWLTFSAGMAPLVVGLFFMGGVQLFFLGMMGEYILSMNERVKNRPLVIEKERINFNEES